VDGVDGTAWRGTGGDCTDGNHHLAKVRVAGSNPVFRSKKNLRHDQNSLLALLIAAAVAHLVSVLVLKRSILTEKVARRGFHVMREYVPSIRIEQMVEDALGP
jgi:hypothetical protein